MIPKNFSHSNDNRNNYQKESLKCTSILLFSYKWISGSNMGFIKSSKEHISHTHRSYMYV